jgi:hypothetical protein
MKSNEIKKGLKEIKSFIISEMKNEDSNWRKLSNESLINYYSKWLDISVFKNGDVEIHLNNSGSYYITRYNIKDIGLSKMRFNWLMKFYVEKFIKNKEEREKMEIMVSNWNSFLDKNKSLNRNKKLEEILK